jgi:signal transduction histidine kinase
MRIRGVRAGQVVDVANERSTFLASAGRELALSLEHEGARDAVRRRTLSRAESWCIVDIVELDGGISRLDVAHPDPRRQRSAQRFADRWPPTLPRVIASPFPAPIRAVDRNSVSTAQALGFGDLLVVPLVARDRILGAITFIARNGDAAFSRDEIGLASDLADLCALALDNERLYREARELRRSAEDANRAKSAFVGNMSHELMTPLHAIAGHVALIEMGIHGAVSPAQLVDLERIRHNQVHLSSLIADLLIFARSESGGLEYHITQVSADAMLREVADMLQVAAQERGLTLTHVPGGDVAQATADPARVRQILLNLVMNAIKYATAGDVMLSAVATADAVAIRIADAGPGIPAEKLEAIFDPFVQLAAGLADRRGGVGLGLAISRDMARAMNGELTVSSSQPGGSTFTLTLPRAAAESPARFVSPPKMKSR